VGAYPLWRWYMTLQISRMASVLITMLRKTRRLSYSGS